MPFAPDAAKVLIVDDEPDVLESTALLVEALGYQAIRLADPTQVLPTVESERPGVILQDLKMPGLNVAGLVAALRLNPRTAEVPIVFFSAGGDLAMTAARLDAWGYLPKPFGKEELARMLAQVLGPPQDVPPMTRTPGPALEREVRGVLRDYWNALAALNNGLLALGRVAPPTPDTQAPLAAMGDLLLKLESKTDRLGILLRGLAASPTSPEGGEPASPLAEGEPTIL
jgi:CheY-like chemotaxis protein